MILTCVYVWLLNKLPASNITDTNINTPESFNTSVNDTEPQAHLIFDDAIETTNQIIPLSSTSHTIQNLMDESATINEILARPFLVTDIHLNVPGISLSNSLTLPLSSQSFVKILSLPSDILRDPNKMSKLEYFRYFTADMKIRIETNAQPYMSGKFWIFYNPHPDLIIQGKAVETSRLASLTSYPGVEYDLNQMSNAEISIPFISYERAFDLEKPLDYCNLYVTQLTPIRDITTETNLRMRVYGWFENIKVFGATSKSNVSQQFLLNKIKEYNNQLNVRFHINNRSEQGGGIISNVASNVSTLAKSLSNVPIIGSVSSNIGWMSDVISKTASIFGYSRPTSSEPNCKITNVPSHGYTYSQNVDQSVILASQPDNELGPQTKVFQTEVDEMDFEYISQNPGVITTFVYTTSSDNSDWLLNVPCSLRPFNYSHSVTVGDNNFAMAAPICSEYLAGLFKFWRGTICFKISIAKTPFHNGRLLLSFDPSNNISDTPADRIGKTYSTILDLSENSSIIVKIPFISKFDYLNTYSDDDDLEKVSFGTFSIGSLAPLLCPASVDTSVDVVVWKWAENVEYSIPFSIYDSCVGVDTSDPLITIDIPNSGFYSWERGTVPFTSTSFSRGSGNDESFHLTASDVNSVLITDGDNGTSYDIESPHELVVYNVTYQIQQSDGSWSDPLSDNLNLATVPAPYYHVRIISNFNVQFQINLMNRDEENVIVFNNPNIDTSFIHSLDCIGEKLVNARTLLRMHRERPYNDTASNTPFSDALTLPALPYFYVNSTYVKYLSRMYRFYRGGFSYKLFSSNIASRNEQISSLSFFDDGARVAPSNTHSHLSYSDLTSHEVRVPFYSQTFRRVICDEYANSQNVDYCVPAYRNLNTTTVNHFFEAGDDSLSYGWLVGPPVIAYIRF